MRVWKQRERKETFQRLKEGKRPSIDHSWRNLCQIPQHNGGWGYRGKSFITEPTQNRRLCVYVCVCTWVFMCEHVCGYVCLVQGCTSVLIFVRECVHTCVFSACTCVRVCIRVVSILSPWTDRRTDLTSDTLKDYEEKWTHQRTFSYFLRLPTVVSQFTSWLGLLYDNLYYSFYLPWLSFSSAHHFKETHRRFVCKNFKTISDSPVCFNGI